MYSCILHATDLSENHFAMCQQAAEIAKCFGASLHILYVLQPPSSLQLAQGLGFAEFDSPVKEDAQAVLAVIGEALGLPVERQHVAIGSIKMHILEQARALGAELIIMGSHTPSALPPLLGSTTHAVINHAHCDVLTIRSRKD